MATGEKAAILCLLSTFHQMLEQCRLSPAFTPHQHQFDALVWTVPAQHNITLHQVASHCIMLHHIASCCITLHHVASHCIILHHITSDCIILHHIASCCIIQTLHHLPTHWKSTLASYPVPISIPTSAREGNRAWQHWGVEAVDFHPTISGGTNQIAESCT